MKSIAFIFARGGSKGLPGKNIKPLAGKPLIQYSIESALKCSFISNLFVSTDDPNIAEVARQLGAIIIDRPKNLAEDKSPEWLAWQHAIQWVIQHYGLFDEFISLPTTSPLRSDQDIISAIEKRRHTGADICLSVTPANRSPYFNMVKLLPAELVELVIPAEKQFSHRQDTPELFDITTVVYASSPSYILNNHSIFDGSVTTITVPKERAVDIDDIYDFLLAETLLNYRNNNVIK